MSFGESTTFHENISPAFLGSESRTKKKPAEVGDKFSLSFFQVCDVLNQDGFSKRGALSLPPVSAFFFVVVGLLFDTEYGGDIPPK
jgi:hypothetical protein